MPSGGARSRWRRIARRSLRGSIALLLEALTTFRVVATIVVVEVLVRTTPLPRAGRLLGCRIDLSPASPSTKSVAPELTPRARRQLRCTHRVADRWPFSRGPCLRRALVGGHLLRRFRPSVRLGLTADAGEMSAHAWLEIDGRPLEDVSRYSRFEQAHRQIAS